VRAAVFAGLALVGAALLAIAEFTTLYDVVVGSLDIVRRSAKAGDEHSYALVILAGAAVPMALGALRAANTQFGGMRGARAPALALAVLGGVALYIAFVRDLPDTRSSGRLPESVTFEDARARPGPGLYLEIAGGGLLILSGGGLLVTHRPRPRAIGAHGRDDPL
jgi:hypothetical protein